MKSSIKVLIILVLVILWIYLYYYLTELDFSDVEVKPGKSLSNILAEILYGNLFEDFYLRHGRYGTLDELNIEKIRLYNLKVEQCRRGYTCEVVPINDHQDFCIVSWPTDWRNCKRYPCLLVIKIGDEFKHYKSKIDMTDTIKRQGRLTIWDIFNLDEIKDIENVEKYIFTEPDSNKWNYIKSFTYED